MSKLCIKDAYDIHMTKIDMIALIFISKENGSDECIRLSQRQNDKKKILPGKITQIKEDRE